MPARLCCSSRDDFALRISRISGPVYGVKESILYEGWDVEDQKSVLYVKREFDRRKSQEEMIS